MSAKLQVILDGKACPGLVEYLKLAARENGEQENLVLTEARDLYKQLSKRLHTQETVPDDSFPVDVFEGRARSLAYAALAFATTGRDITLYDFDEDGKRVDIDKFKLRVFLSDICLVTLNDLVAADVL